MDILNVTLQDFLLDEFPGELLHVPETVNCRFRDAITTSHVEFEESVRIRSQFLVGCDIYDIHRCLRWYFQELGYKFKNVRICDDAFLIGELRIPELGEMNLKSQIMHDCDYGEGERELPVLSVRIECMIDNF